MKWLEQLNKLFKKEEKEEQEIPIKPIEEIPFEELCTKVEDKIKELDDKEKQLKEGIISRIAIFEKELEPIKEELLSFDLSKRKEDEKLKFIVEENRRLYLSLLDNLVNNLKKIEPQNIKDYIKNVEHTINHFTKLSRMPFERTTILIGKEAESIIIIFKNFVSDTHLLISSNDSLFKKKDAGESFIKLLEEVKSHESSLKEIFITSKELEEKSKKSIEEKKKIEDKISDVLQSQEYQEDKKIKQDKTLEKEIIEREIQRARENMPWKELLNVYHHNEKKREFIKNYRKGFTKSLEEDKELQMNVLLQEMNCANNINFKELQMKISKMYVPIILPTDEKIYYLKNKIEQLERELENVVTEQANYKRKIDKLLIKKEEIIKHATNKSQFIL